MCWLRDVAWIERGKDELGRWRSRRSGPEQDESGTGRRASQSPRVASRSWEDPSRQDEPSVETGLVRDLSSLFVESERAFRTERKTGVDPKKEEETLTKRRRGREGKEKKEETEEEEDPRAS
jgi:hypothetical protein